MLLISLPEQILPQLAAKNIENIFFKKHLRNYTSSFVDEQIHLIAKQTESQIDCMACGNCCKKLEPGLTDTDIEKLAQHANMDVVAFKQNWVAFDSETAFLKTKPCMFLVDCKCTIYQSRPEACKAYPHLDGTNLKYKQSLWSNYAVCPIVFNVVEQLKTQLDFVYER